MGECARRWVFLRERERTPAAIAYALARFPPFRRMCPRMPAPVVPNHQKKRNDVRIVNSPLPPTKPSYGASPAVVPVGLMQKGRLKSTQKSPN